MRIYVDKHGRRYLLVSETRGGIHAWFRPVEHANDGYYDVNRRMSEMRFIAAGRS